MKGYTIDYGEVLGLLGEMFELFTRRDVGWILAGYRPLPSARHTYHVFRRLTKQELIEQRIGGEQAQFVLSDAGRRRCQLRSPAVQWGRPWDGRWRAVIYDVPELRRTERLRLWRALRRRSVGLLQRSVWVWPHPLTEMLQEMIAVEHVPEWLCGLDADRLLLCADAELVAAAWDWDEISQRHRVYLGNPTVRPSQTRAAVDLPSLSRLVRLEGGAYRYAFGRDPLLPQALWPKGYRGPAVEQRHGEFMASARRRWGHLSAGLAR